MITVCSSVLTLSLLLSVNCENVIRKVTPHNHLESAMLLLLENWRTGYVNSDILPLPSLKTVKIPYVEHTYEGKGIKLTYALNKMELAGLDSFSIEELSISQTTKNLEMAIALRIPKLSLYAEKYEIKGRAYLLYPLKGSGNMTVLFGDTNINFKLRFAEEGINTINTRVKDFLLDFNIAKIEANLVGSSWPINKVLNSDGVEIITSYHDDIVQALWDYTVPYMDQHLVNITTAQIVDMLLNVTVS